MVAAFAASAAVVAGGHDDRHLTTNQIGRECWQSIILTLRPAIFDRDILALDNSPFP